MMTYMYKFLHRSTLLPYFTKRKISTRKPFFNLCQKRKKKKRKVTFLSLHLLLVGHETHD